MIFDGCRDSTIAYGFDSVKFDGCSEFQNMTKWMSSFEAAKWATTDPTNMNRAN